MAPQANGTAHVNCLFPRDPVVFEVRSPHALLRSEFCKTLPELEQCICRAKPRQHLFSVTIHAVMGLFKFKRFPLPAMAYSATVEPKGKIIHDVEMEFRQLFFVNVAGSASDRKSTRLNSSHSSTFSSP